MKGLPTPHSAILAQAAAMEAFKDNPADINPRSWEMLSVVGLSAAFRDLEMRVDDDEGHNDAYRFVSRWIEKEKR